jgi:hypothetical protein
MAGTLQPLIDLLSKAFTSRSSQLRGVAPGTDFFTEQVTLEEIFKLFDRSDYVQRLKDLDQKSGPTQAWVAAHSPVEFMAGLERDLHARYKSRLDHYRAAAVSKNLPPLFFERYRTMIEKLEAAPA